MSLQQFFYPRLVNTEFTWDELYYAIAALVAIVWTSVWFKHKRTGKWGWGLSGWGALFWFVAVLCLVAYQFSEVFVFTGRFIHGLKMEDHYVTTYTPTPDPSLVLETRRVGFRLTVFHVGNITMDDGRGHQVPGKELDYVRHIWVSPSEYTALLAELRDQKLPPPSLYNVRLLYRP
jgi:hypothetical protein